MSKYRLTDVEWMLDPSCPIERVGSEWLVIRESAIAQSQVLRLSAASAEVVTMLRRGPAPLPQYLMAAASELEVWGVVYPVHKDPGLHLGRRQFIRMGVGGAAVGIAVLALPTAAAAQSQATSGGIVSTFELDTQCYSSHWFDTDADFIVGAGGVTADILLLGGGGGGGAGRSTPTTLGAGGGAGGAIVRQFSVSLAAGTYPVIVGLGGNTSTAGQGGDGLVGGTSSVAGVNAVGGSGGIGALGSRNGGDSVNYVGGAGNTFAGGGGAGDHGGGAGASQTGTPASTANSKGGDGGLGEDIQLGGVWRAASSDPIWASLGYDAEAVPDVIGAGGGGGGGGATRGVAVNGGGDGGRAGTGSTDRPSTGEYGGGGGGARGGQGTATGGNGVVFIRYRCPV